MLCGLPHGFLDNDISCNLSNLSYPNPTSSNYLTDQFDLMHRLDTGRVVPKFNPFVPQLHPILGQRVCCWKEWLAEWGSLSWNKKEGKRARQPLDDKTEDLPVDLLSVDVHSQFEALQRDRNVIALTFPPQSWESLLHSDTGGTSWINSFMYWLWGPCAYLWECIHKLFLSVVVCCFWLVAGRKITYCRMQPLNVTGSISS